MWNAFCVAVVFECSHKRDVAPIMTTDKAPAFLMILLGISLNGVKCQTIRAPSKFTCHCMSDAPCDPDTLECPDGCEPGWYGPGCQIGNIAYRKKAIQSSTHRKEERSASGGPPMVAAYAVDGVMPTPASGDLGCSHTDVRANTSSPWWYVMLADVGFYVIRNVTIYNRQDQLGSRLRDFSILVDNNTNSNPSSGNWYSCAYQREQPEDVSSYSCGNATGRRVGIIVREHPSVLCLCEVVVDGYKYSRCDLSHTGPGCLEKSCDPSRCQAAGGTCDLENVCQLPELFFIGVYTAIIGIILGVVAIIIVLAAVVIICRCCNAKLSQEPATPLLGPTIKDAEISANVIKKTQSSEFAVAQNDKDPSNLGEVPTPKSTKSKDRILQKRSGVSVMSKASRMSRASKVSAGSKRSKRSRSHKKVQLSVISIRHGNRRDT